MPRGGVMRHLLTDSTSPIGENIGLVFTKTSRGFFSPFVSTKIIAHRLFSAMCEITYIAPLYKRTEVVGVEEWEANLSDKAYKQLTQYLLYSPSPIEVFDYVYGILHDPIYIERFDEYLCRDFPRVPIINAPKESDDDFIVTEDMFHAYVAAGEHLRKLHLMQTKTPAAIEIDPPTATDLEIGAIKYKDGTLQLNPNKCIAGIPEDVWNYRIGGYQVLDKWFKSHKGKTMSIDDFDHIVNVVGLLAETIKIQDELASLHK